MYYDYDAKTVSFQIYFKHNVLMNDLFFLTETICLVVLASEPYTIHKAFMGTILYAF